MPKQTSGAGKTYANSSLKALAPNLQRELFDYMEGVGDQKGHTYKECIAWLKKAKVQACSSQLSRWRDWYWLRVRLEWCHETAEQMAKDDLRAGHDYTDEQIERKGNRTFNLLAIRTCNGKAWALQQTLALRKQAITATQQKLAFEIQKYENQRAKAKQTETEPQMTPEEKEERIRQIMGTE